MFITELLLQMFLETVFCFLGSGFSLLVILGKVFKLWDKKFYLPWCLRICLQQTLRECNLFWFFLGCFNKDQVYLDGILRILRYRESIDFHLLTALGKVSGLIFNHRIQFYHLSKLVCKDLWVTVLCFALIEISVPYSARNTQCRWRILWSPKNSYQFFFIPCLSD